MATIADRDWVEQRREATRWSFLLPPLFGVFALAVPSFSKTWALVVAGGCAAALAGHVFFRARHGYRSPADTARYSTFQVDLMCFFIAVFAWRVTRAPWWLLALFVAVLAAVALVGLVWRRTVLQELYAPQTRLGVLLAGSAALGTAGGGAVGYALGRSTGGWAAGTALLMIACYVVLARHALWLKVEEPDWAPRRRRRA